MQVLSAEQIRAWDLYTIEHEPISSLDLMERASGQCTKWLIEKGLVQRPIKIFCGKGNNGGDGLAIASQLAENSIIADVYILEFGAAGTSDFQHNLSRLHAYPNAIHFIQEPSFFPIIDEDDIVIDALYGSGVNRPLTGLSAGLVQHINQSKATVVSIDLPSGMFADTSTIPNPVINAAHTLTFQSLKMCFLLPENEEHVGDLHVLNIGLHPGYVSTVRSNHVLVDRELIGQIYKPRKNFAHKGNFGHSLLLAGNTGKMGAAVLCTKACLRAGTGLATACINQEDFYIMQVAVPEAMVIGRNAINVQPFNAIGIGPGLGTSGASIEVLKSVLKDFRQPLVLDADALNILSQHVELFDTIPANSILTPHPKEFTRLFGECHNDFERLELAGKKAMELKLFIVLKGHRTAIACPDGKMYFNTTGNPGMATAGSGDVLTGIITALLSQKYAPGQAAILGVYLHGLAGDIAAKHLSQEAMIAGDIVGYLGEAYQTIAQQQTEAPGMM